MMHSISFSDRIHATACVQAPELAHRLRRWAHSLVHENDDLIVALCAEIERLAPYETPEFPPRVTAPAAWTDKHKVLRTVATRRPDLRARLTDWLHDEYPTGVDDLFVALGEEVSELADVEDRLESAEDDLARCQDERDEYDRRCMDAEDRLEVANEELARLQAVVAELRAEVARRPAPPPGPAHTPAVPAAWQRLAGARHVPRVAP